jgi:hypothetical protein
MKTIIAGSRSAGSYNELLKALAGIDWTPTQIISGGARGADRLGEEWARKNNVRLRRFPADWDRHGKRAGYLRNAQMLQHADALVALWDGESRGTAHMIRSARKRGLKIHVHRLP